MPATIKRSAQNANVYGTYGIMSSDSGVRDGQIHSNCRRRAGCPAMAGECRRHADLARLDWQRPRDRGSARAMALEHLKLEEDAERLLENSLVSHRRLELRTASPHARHLPIVFSSSSGKTGLRN
jgi:hypothetical protein